MEREARTSAVRKSLIIFNVGVDYTNTKAKPNRFAGRARPGSVAVLLDPDVARVFQSAKSVNAVLRALVATMNLYNIAKTGNYGLIF